ncbi:MFS transporter [Paenibacillus filicis]|uniref:MFS transporter n=1 Tax=Paenibacillus gyeongsangnamensis TaxID=3388067 RepID=A0ABT4Q5S4_9BACL|nr:MFS transporter [Paenibacillus filicis]MCZ8512224.1 MFS transporter [Paenibacillus filicis]
MALTAKSVPLGPRAAAEEPRRRPGVMLAVMMLSVFMAVANNFIVNVATPAIQRGLQSSFSGVQFVITGYTLAYAVALIIGGRFGDRFGRKKMLLLGVAGFTLASLFCGLAPGVEFLVMARILQGLSAALITPQVLSLIQVNYPPEKRGAVFGMYGATQGIAASSGQMIGGLLLRIDPWGLDWRTVFFFSVPIGIVILALIPLIGESKQSAGSKLDWFGAVLVAAGLLLLVYPLVQGQKDGWPISLIVSLILALPALATFVWFEKGLIRRSREPFMNVDLFRQRVFSLGMLIVFLLLCAQAAFFLVTAYLLQIGLGFTALKAGTVILPMGIGYFLASLWSSKAVSRFGPHVLTIGSILTFLGYLSLALFAHLTGTSLIGYEWLPVLAVLGFGQGLIASPLTNIVLAKIRKDDIGSASGILTTGMQVAYAIGIAVIGVIWLNALNYHADTVSREVGLQLRQSLPSNTVTMGQNDALIQAFQTCYPVLVRENDPASVEPECRPASFLAPAKQLYENSVRQANAQNYMDSYILCLYVLAAISACIFPLVLALARSGKKRPQP